MRGPFCGPENREKAKFRGECTAPLSSEVPCPEGTVNQTASRHFLALRREEHVTRYCP